MRLIKLLILLLICMVGNYTYYAQAQQQNQIVSLNKPVVLPPTDVTEQGFTANWEKVENAEAYCVFVYTEHEATEKETFTLLYEDFDLIDFGSVDNPIWSEELYESLDIYTSLPNWTVYGYTTYAQGMVGGVIYSPYIDLRNNEGKYTINLSVYGEAGDEIFVHAVGKTEETQSFKLTRTGLTYTSLSFNNGTQDTYFHINNTQGSNFFLDEASATQELQAGDKAYVLVDLNEEVTGGKTSASFKKLRFAPQAKKVFYDVYAVKRIYDDPIHPDRFNQIYSEYSDKMVVNLGKQTSISHAEKINVNVYRTAEGIGVNLAEAGRVEVFNIIGEQVMNRTCEAGNNVLAVPCGMYIVRVDNLTYKIYI